MSISSTHRPPNMTDLLSGLTTRDDATRKMAAFKLQSLISDPSFVETFAAQGGLLRLRTVILESTGNTLAYSLTSFARLLETEHGWEVVNKKLVQKAVELVVCQPLVNILRAAMAVLANIVARPSIEGRSTEAGDYIGGFKALKPAIGQYPQFLEMLVSRLSSADHALCANALQLINALMRDTITVDDEAEWPKFIKRTQDLGVIKAVYILMQSSAIADLAHPLLEFQELTKILLGRWKDVPVNIQKSEHRRTIKAIHLNSDPPGKDQLPQTDDIKAKHDPYKWRRLGFTTESPEPDFANMGFLGMMDFSDYVRKHQDEFQRILADQTLLPFEKRCPLARASLTVTAILFEHFEVDKVEEGAAHAYAVLETRASYEELFKPLLLHWNRLHVAGLHAWIRLWRETGAELDDFHKITELIRILIESIVGSAERTKSIEAVEQELAGYELKRLRELQMELLDMAYDDAWSGMLRGTRDDLQVEAVQFVKEQRIRCLLNGGWFGTGDLSPVTEVASAISEHGRVCRWIQLSADRKYLYWEDHDQTIDPPPQLGSMHRNVPLDIVSSVVSNVTATEVPDSTGSSQRTTTTKITIHGYDIGPTRYGTKGKHSRQVSKASLRAQSGGKETVMLVFQPANATVAAEWLDGLLMLLEQPPITSESNKIIKMISDLGLQIRLLNVRGNDEIEMIEGADGIEAPEVPSREGLDEDYYYEV